jgi:hypothetical protein
MFVSGSNVRILRLWGEHALSHPPMMKAKSPVHSAEAYRNGVGSCATTSTPPVPGLKRTMSLLTVVQAWFVHPPKM